MLNLCAPIAQRIEHRPAKLGIQVRFLMGAPLNKISLKTPQILRKYKRAANSEENMNSILQVPKPQNEPILGYTSGSKEKK